MLKLITRPAEKEVNREGGRVSKLAIKSTYVKGVTSLHNLKALATASSTSSVVIIDISGSG